MKIINPKIYNQKYFLSERDEGFHEYKKNQLSPIKEEEVKLLKLKLKDKILDIGCGRGDIIYYLSKNGFDFRAIDYSKDAIKITKSRIPKKQHSWIKLGNAKEIEFPKKSFNKIIIGDVIEHMTYQEALIVINEAHRLLKKNGILLVHTAPNLWFKKYLYPIVLISLKFLNKKMVLKKFEENIKATYKYHVDEYSIIDLKKIFKKSKFRKFKVWVNPDVLRVDSDNYLNSIKNNLLIKSATFLINKTFLVNLFGNDLFVLAKK